MESYILKTREDRKSQGNATENKCNEYIHLPKMVDFTPTISAIPLIVNTRWEWDHETR